MDVWSAASVSSGCRQSTIRVNLDSDIRPDQPNEHVAVDERSEAPEHRLHLTPTRD